MTRPPKYTAEQLRFLRNGYTRSNVRDLTAKFNSRFTAAKTEAAINSALKNHGIVCGRPQKDRLIERRLRIYTEKQIEFLRTNYPGKSLAELTVLFNRTFKETKTAAQLRSAVHNRQLTSGRTGRFERGNKPWNAGTKGQGLTGRNKTSFRNGNVPANRKPIGSKRIDSKDGYTLVKVRERDPYTGFPTRYKLEHVHLWEQAHGPVPDGMTVIFADGDNTHIRLDNFMLVSRAQLLRLNHHGYKNAPAELKPSILALARLETKAFSIQNKREGAEEAEKEARDGSAEAEEEDRAEL